MKNRFDLFEDFLGNIVIAKTHYKIHLSKEELRIVLDWLASQGFVRYDWKPEDTKKNQSKLNFENKDGKDALLN